MQLKIQTGPVLNGHRRIDVKFTLRNLSEIPSGIENRWRMNEEALDTVHAANAVEMGRAELAEVGRVREGRVDTGECVINNLMSVQVGTIRRAFTNNGFVLSEVFTYQHKKSLKPVLVLRYLPKGEGVNSVAPPAFVTAALRVLGSAVWNLCNLWDNPDGSITINLNGKVGKVAHEPDYAIVVQKGCVYYKTLPEQAITEVEEDQMR